MSAVQQSALGYRTWEGAPRRALWRFWPIARTSAALVLRRRAFWLILFLGLLSFLFQFSRIYLTSVQMKVALSGQPMPVFLERFSRRLLFDASGDGYREFLLAQGTVLMLLLGFAAPIIAGNDLRYRAIDFYLSKPVDRSHYFLGKILACSLIAALLTLAPALVLFIEFGVFTESFDYYIDNAGVLAGIVSLSAIMCVVFSTILLAVAALLRRAVPILVVWSGIFVVLPVVARVLRRALRGAGGESWAWGLIDPWSCLRWVSHAIFETAPETYTERFPAALAVLVGWSLLAVVVFWRRIRPS